ncbi:hypothetical protein GMDG_02059 [Pseudogymnoascus destructans 20631-21]|uniref:Fumarylacetoacetase-like C-terminal domain-containing protein n=1 Tax=Pseudogymnoascus destructans (strain ATCC MYA-4855 / 20631-21) TaxID=658429 RepID=L8FZ24_PSED2|nr:hypothetical protein GMDG_02059 [Pseudogymnoascus destructans 20631-21]
MSSSFTRLVRFLATDGRTYYGDAILPTGVTDLAKTKQARIIEGSIFGNYKITNKIVDIKRLLTPLALEDVRTVRCSGLNYEKHARESNLPLPDYPVLFYKPIMREIVVIGKPCSDVSESEALDYILGYAVGNDVSHRDWQLKYGDGQWGIGKGFDGWGPFGPGIVSNKVIGNPQSLRVSTKVNGKTVQDDMIFGIAKSIAFLSIGTTLLPGDDKPSGVGMGMSLQCWLKDADVDVSLENVGTVSNTVRFDKPTAKL